MPGYWSKKKETDTEMDRAALRVIKELSVGKAVTQYEINLAMSTAMKWHQKLKAIKDITEE